MKALLIALLLPFSAFAGVAEYSVNGETRLYDTECFWNSPQKFVASESGGYSYAVYASKEDCRVTGTFAKVDIYKYDFVTSGTILFKGTEWLPAQRAELRKSKIDSAYNNTLNAGFTTQVVKLEFRNF